MLHICHSRRCESGIPNLSRCAHPFMRITKLESKPLCAPLWSYGVGENFLKLFFPLDLFKFGVDDFFVFFFGVTRSTVGT